MIRYRAPHSPPPPPLTRAERRYLWLVIWLLVASSNLFLLNNLLAVRNSAGENVLGIRDILMAIVMIKGLRWRDGRLCGPWSSPYSKVCLCILVLTPLAALVGLASGGSGIEVARETVTMSTWSLPLIIAPNLRGERAIILLGDAVVALSVLISVGVLIEAVSRMSLRIVTPTPVDAASIRSTPSCWPLMMVGASILLVRIGRRGGRANVLHVVLWFVIVVASLLTQSRTFLVGLFASLAGFLLLSPKRTVSWRYVFGLLALVPVTFQIVIALGTAFIRYDFEPYFMARYSVLSGVESAIEYSEVDTRRREGEMALPAILDSPVVGVGLGTPYRDAIFIPGVPLSEQRDLRILAHNIYIHFVVKYGIPGLLVYLVFNWLVFGSVRRAARMQLPIGDAAFGFSLGMLNLLACAWFGNVFGQTYMAQAAMVVLAAIIACERTARAFRTTATLQPIRVARARTFYDRPTTGTLA